MNRRSWLYLGSSKGRHILAPRLPAHPLTGRGCFYTQCCESPVLFSLPREILTIIQNSKIQSISLCQGICMHAACADQHAHAPVAALIAPCKVGHRGQVVQYITSQGHRPCGLTMLRGKEIHTAQLHACTGSNRFGLC